MHNYKVFLGRQYHEHKDAVYGREIWVSVGRYRDRFDSFFVACEELAEELVNMYSKFPIKINGLEFCVNELTIYFYDKREPIGREDNWTADLLVTKELGGAS
mgnify:CR=1 FL=1